MSDRVELERLVIASVAVLLHGLAIVATDLFNKKEEQFAARLEMGSNWAADLSPEGFYVEAYKLAIAAIAESPGHF